MAVGLAEAGDPFGGGGSGDALVAEGGPDPERDREVGLAGAGRAEHHYVLARVQEVELAEVLDDLALDRALEGEVELLQGLAGAKTSGLDAVLPAGDWREATSVESTASRKRSCDQSSVRARSASLVVALAAAGALSERKRSDSRGLGDAGISPS